MQYALITHRIGLSQIAQMPQIIFIIQLICVSQSPRGGRWAYCNNALITHDMGLTQIDLIKQIYYFLLRFLRFLREIPLPLADCADAAERYMGLTQIDLIIQIYYFLCGFCDFCEILLFLSQTAQIAHNGEVQQAPKVLDHA